MDTPRLSPGMMARYEIEDRRPPRANAVQFGMGDRLMGVVDRLIDAARPGVGIICVEAGQPGHAARLRAQGGLYTVIVRGYAGDQPVRREQVVQCVLDAVEPDGVDALAANPGIEFGIVEDSPEARALAARYIAARAAAGLGPVEMLDLSCGGAGFPALSDGLAFRAERDEAAKLCAEMNYLDEMLYLAEPCARLTVCAPEDFRRRTPLDTAPGVSFADAGDLALERTLVRRAFDAGVFLMAGAGWLNGCDTLRDCMTHARLRRFVGEAFTEELMPLLGDVPRDALEARVIECFGRYEDPLNRNRVLRAGRGLLAWLRAEGVPMMRRWADERFEPPRRLAFALAATIMLYAGARYDPDAGRFEVARGSLLEALDDDPEKLRIFAALSHDMPPETLAYAALADRELWDGADLREIDGLEARVALDIAAMQRRPDYIPE